MYLCDYCGAAFHSLDYIEEKSDECGNSIIYVCPECGEEIIPGEADECPVCHGWKPMKSAMCHKCELETIGNFKLAIRKFSDVQLDYISVLTEGEYLSEFCIRGAWDDKRRPPVHKSYSGNPIPRGENVL